MLRKIFLFIIQFMAKLFSKSNLLIKLFRIAVQVFDNDQNVNIKNNGELRLLRQMIKTSKKSSIFFDVGANTGDYSLELINNGLDSKLFIVEPNKKSITLAIKKLLKHNYKNFYAMNLALSNENRKSINFFNPLNSKESVLASLYDMRSIGYHTKINKIKVKVKKLTNILSQFKIKKVHFIKIDVEGNEFNVIKGAEKFIDNGNINFIQFEFGHATRAARVYLHDIVFFLEARGYKIYVIKPSGLLPLNFTPWSENCYSYINFLAANKNSLKDISDIIIDN